MRIAGFFAVSGLFVAASFAAPASAAPVAAELRVCAACHSFGAGEPNRLGPNLNGFCARPVGKAEGFAYSSGFKASTVKWNAASLDSFLENPRKAMPGTRMAAAPIGDPAKRTATIAALTEATGCKTLK